jgi:hypothetical protein
MVDGVLLLAPRDGGNKERQSLICTHFQLFLIIVVFCCLISNMIPQLKTIKLRLTQLFMQLFPSGNSHFGAWSVRSKEREGPISINLLLTERERERLTDQAQAHPS